MTVELLVVDARVGDTTFETKVGNSCIQCIVEITRRLLEAVETLLELQYIAITIRVTLRG
jgi:hypothetical protein